MEKLPNGVEIVRVGEIENRRVYPAETIEERFGWTASDGGFIKIFRVKNSEDRARAYSALAFMPTEIVNGARAYARPYSQLEAGDYSEWVLLS